MSETIEICQHGEIQEVELTGRVRGALLDAGAEICTESEYELKKRVEDLLYDLATVTVRESSGSPQVHVQDKSGEEASVDYGQPQKIDEADDVQIVMIRPEQFTVGWKDDE